MVIRFENHSLSAFCFATKKKKEIDPVYLSWPNAVPLEYDVVKTKLLDVPWFIGDYACFSFFFLLILILCSILAKYD